MFAFEDYKKIASFIEESERVLYEDAIPEEYSHDELGGTFSKPSVVVRVTKEEEIIDIVKYAYDVYQLECFQVVSSYQLLLQLLVRS